MPLRADFSDKQKKALFLHSKTQSTQTSRSGSPIPHKKSTHLTSSSHKKTSLNHKHHSSTSSSTSKKEHSSTSPHSVSSPSPTPSTITSTNTHHSSSTSSFTSEKENSSPSAHPVSSPSPSASGITSTKTLHSSSLSHDTIIPIDTTHHTANNPLITIEKSGTIPDQGLEPIPTVEPAKKGHWGWLFGSNNSSYHYLSGSVRRAIDSAPVRRGRWKYIVVHNSGTRAGNARSFDIYHRRVRKMVNGLAYHFVIGNGVSSGNGEIEIGHRWTAQINGGHVASDYLNDISLGICLVGDYNNDEPTKAQLGALNELISYLRQRVGKTQGRQAMVEAHKEINPRPTDCPGTHFPYSWLHGRFGYGR